jgi:hypothetical protein
LGFENQYLGSFHVLNVCIQTILCIYYGDKWRGAGSFQEKL